MSKNQRNELKKANVEREMVRLLVVNPQARGTAAWRGLQERLFLCEDRESRFRKFAASKTRQRADY